MIVSHQYKFIFIHINKCAGSSMTYAIAPHLGEEDIVLGVTPEGEKLSREWKKKNGLHKHATAAQVKEVLGDEIWNSYFKFSFVRNPWDMLVSTYHWWLETSWDDEKGTSQKIKDLKNFEEYVLSPYCRKRGCFEFLTDREGNVLVDFVGKQEYLEQDFAYICGKVGLPNIDLPHRNASQHMSYMEYYDQELRKVVRRRFVKDVKTFNYSFKGG
jgi:Sulfotransferase family